MISGRRRAGTPSPYRREAIIVKLVAQFRRPPDPEQLLADVIGLVIPHCRQIPGVQRVALASSDDYLGEIDVLRSQRGDRRGPPFLTAELYFESRATFDEALATPEAESALGELMDIADRNVHVFLADVQPEG